MKKSFTKVIAILLALSVMLTCGVPVFADYSATQSGYGAKSGSGNVMIWSLTVTSTIASSIGSLVGGYSGNVYCYAAVTGNSTSSTQSYSNSATLSGNGLAAQIAFTQVAASPVTDGCDQRIGSGSRSGSTSQVTWAIEAAPSYASSSGSIFNGYYGMVYCGITVNGNWYETDVANSNMLSMLGSDTYAEIWIR